MRELALLSIWSAAKLRLESPLALHEAPTAAAARGRALVACLAVDHRVCSAASVARYLHRAKATLSEQIVASGHARRINTSLPPHCREYWLKPRSFKAARRDARSGIRGAH